MPASVGIDPGLQGVFAPPVLSPGLTPPALSPRLAWPGLAALEMLDTSGLRGVTTMVTVLIVGVEPLFGAVIARSYVPACSLVGIHVKVPSLNVAPGGRLEPDKVTVKPLVSHGVLVNLIMLNFMHLT